MRIYSLYVNRNIETLKKSSAFYGIIQGDFATIEPYQADKEYFGIVTIEKI